MVTRLLTLVCCAALFIGATPRHSRHSPPQTLTAQAIEQARLTQGQKNNPALIVKAEVLLDRTGFSPCVIDGHNADNFRNAVAGYQQQNGPNATGALDPDPFEALASS